MSDANGGKRGNGKDFGIRADRCVIAETTSIFAFREKIKRLRDVSLPGPWSASTVKLNGGPFRDIALPYPNGAEDLLIGLPTTADEKWLAIYRVNFARTEALFVGVIHRDQFGGLEWGKAESA